MTQTTPKRTETDWKWYYSRNEEEYYGGYDTREEAVSELKVELTDWDQDSGWIVEAQKENLQLADLIDWEGVFENAAERAEDNYGNPDGGHEIVFPDLQPLEKVLGQVVKTWQAENKIEIVPYLFTGMRNSEVITRG